MGEKLTRQETAKTYKVSIRTLDYLVATNQIPYIRFGKRNVRFDTDMLAEWERERVGVEYRRNKKN